MASASASASSFPSPPDAASPSPFQVASAATIFALSCAGVIGLALRPQSFPLLPEAWWRALLARTGLWRGGGPGSAADANGAADANANAPRSPSSSPPPPPPCPPPPPPPSPARARARIPSAPRLACTYALPPAAGALLMLAAGALSPAGLWRGVAGDARIQPYAIVLVFLGLAYLSAALDATGAFAWAALAVARRARGRGRPLYFLFFAASSALTLLTSNDVSVMALAPLVLHTCAASGEERERERGEEERPGRCLFRLVYLRHRPRRRAESAPPPSSLAHALSPLPLSPQ